jgi:two-component system, OmpR family, sensor histidine kinase MtrB
VPQLSRLGDVAYRVRRWWVDVVVGRWRASLQLRVVVTTILLGLVVVTVVGSILLSQISDGLVESRRKGAENESAVVFSDANQFIASYQAANDPGQLASDLVNRLAGPAADPLRIVVLLPASTGESVIPVSGRSSTGLSNAEIDSVIPVALRSQVNALPGRQPSTSVALPVPGSGDAQRTVPAVAVGTLVDLGQSAGGTYELYLIYRMDREVQVLQLVQRIFLLGGVFLVLLVGAVAFVVTRQVVAPVRQAASTAEELASGRLDRRMRVRGDDDLARLGRAFNEMAASLERQIHRLEELSRAQRQFVSDVSHELRTPLTTIRMAGEVMYEAREDFDPAVARSAELLQTQLDRFETLLTDLLEISRFDAGAARLDAEPFDVRELVHRVVDGLGPLAERHGSRIVVHDAEDTCFAECDPRRVERIVRNLVANAIEHGEGGDVTISLAADEDAAAVSVRDHGVGLRPEELALVFNRFWRADPARARTTGGTGLGLPIAQEDAHLHGGWLQVWGRPGEGANFRLTLPRRSGVLLERSPLPLVPDDAVAGAVARAGLGTGNAETVGSAGTDTGDGAGVPVGDGPGGSRRV